MLWNSGGMWHSGQVDHPDTRLLRAVRRRADHPAAVAATRAASWAGEHAAVWIVGGLAAAGADGQRRAQWLRATGLVVGAQLASMAVKRVVRRPRPVLEGLEPLVGTAGPYSFPSSHATSAVAAAVVFGGMAAVPTAVTVGAGALVVCLSRLTSGVHYPSDVVAGAVLGGAAATLGQHWVASGPTDV